MPNIPNIRITRGLVTRQTRPARPVRYLKDTFDRDPSPPRQLRTLNARRPSEMPIARKSWAETAMGMSYWKAPSGVLEVHSNPVCVMRVYTESTVCVMRVYTEHAGSIEVHSSTVCVVCVCKEHAGRPQRQGYGHAPGPLYLPNQFRKTTCENASIAWRPCISSASRTWVWVSHAGQIVGQQNHTHP